MNTKYVVHFIISIGIKEYQKTSESEKYDIGAALLLLLLIIKTVFFSFLNVFLQTDKSASIYDSKQYVEANEIEAAMVRVMQHTHI